MSCNIKKEKIEEKQMELTPLEKLTKMRGKCDHLGTLIKTFNLELTL
jgi:hypothetical protein